MWTQPEVCRHFDSPFVSSKLEATIPLNSGLSSRSQSPCRQLGSQLNSILARAEARQMPPPPPDKWRVYSTGNEVGQLRQGLVIIYLFVLVVCLLLFLFWWGGGGGVGVGTMHLQTESCCYCGFWVSSVPLLKKCKAKSFLSLVLFFKNLADWRWQRHEHVLSFLFHEVLCLYVFCRKACYTSTQPISEISEI